MKRSTLIEQASYSLSKDLLALQLTLYQYITIEVKSLGLIRILFYRYFFPVLKIVVTLSSRYNFSHAFLKRLPLAVRVNNNMRFIGLYKKSFLECHTLHKRAYSEGNSEVCHNDKYLSLSFIQIISFHNINIYIYTFFL